MAGTPIGSEISKMRFEEALRITGFSKNRLAKESGVSIRDIKRDVNTKGRMTYKKLKIICKTLDINPDYLTDENDYSKNHYYNEQRLSEMKYYLSPYPDADQRMSELQKRLDINSVYVGHYDDYAEMEQLETEYDYLSHYVASKLGIALSEITSSKQADLITEIISQVDEATTAIIEELRKEYPSEEE